MLLSTSAFKGNLRRYIWDNRVLLHAATPFDADKYQRLLFRMEFKGEPVIGPEL
jgi:alpha-ketoglutarate-dependent taurine dioxygenase